jgi:peptidoglycan/LPS O-acetylase OafA/YrhL
LSGFVLAFQINFIISNNFKFADIKTFLIRRWLRTVPPYLAALFSAVIFFGGGDNANIISHIFYMQNFISDSPSKSFFSVGWSLSVEEWFYMLFPFTLLVFFRIGKSKNMNLYASALIIVFSVLARIYLGSQENWGSDVRRAVIFRFDAIVVGYLAYCVKEHFTVRETIIISCVSFVFFMVTTFNHSNLLESQFFQNFFFISCGLFFSFFLILLSKLSVYMGENISTFFCFLARLSYPIYLFHIIFITITRDIIGGNTLLIYALGIHIFAILFHYGFESPILKSRPQYNKTKVLT